MKQEKKQGLITQIYLLIGVGILIIGAFTFLTQYQVSRIRIKNDTGLLASEAVEDLIFSVKEFPAYRWLLLYWAEHADTMDPEYDVDFESGTATEEKCRILQERWPDLQLRYCSQEEVEALPEEDQKLYAEIAYTWLITRINGIKQNLKCDFLFCVMTDTDELPHPYERQFFLLSGADPDSVRGTQYEDVYTLGVDVSVTDKKDTQESMRNAVEQYLENPGGTPEMSGEKLVHAGNYVDYYTCLDVLDGHAVLAGATYNLSDMLKEIRVRARRGTMIAAIYQLLLLAFVMRHIFLYVLRPLKNIMQNIRVYTETKDSRTVEKNLTELLSDKKGAAIRQNEIGQLAEDFIEQTKEVDHYIHQIETVTAEKKRYEVELDVAAQIQSHMLPSVFPPFPDRTNFDLYASMAPAREVGGDFYDYFLVDDDHLALVIADVSDKGVPAALFMVITKILIKNRAQMGESPGEILSNVNNQLVENNELGFFVTVWLAAIELSTGKGVAANAGHEHPAICRKGRKWELVIYKHSPIIAMLEDIIYTEHPFEMHPGDRLFVYTDGVPEATNSHTEQFGTDRMLDALNSNPDASPEELLQDVTKAIDDFVGESPRFDDTTMMCLYYKGSENKNG